MNSNLEKRKITYGCNHYNTMRLSQNLMNEHFRCKHQTKPKNKNLDQIPSWDYSQPCYLCNQTQYCMSEAGLQPYGQKIVYWFHPTIPRIFRRLSVPILAQLSQMQKKHELGFTHDLFLEARKDTRTSYHRYVINCYDESFSYNCLSILICSEICLIVVFMMNVHTALIEHVCSQPLTGYSIHPSKKQTIRFSL